MFLVHKPHMLKKKHNCMVGLIQLKKIKREKKAEETNLISVGFKLKCQPRH